MLDFLKDYKIWILIVFLVADIVAAVLYKIDKKKATAHRWRIPEKVLLGLAVLGGIGARIAMKVFHHKTQKWYFRVWDGFFALLQTAVIVLAFCY